jgi:hypothetical protein
VARRSVTAAAQGATALQPGSHSAATPELIFGEVSEGLVGVFCQEGLVTTLMSWPSCATVVSGWCVTSILVTGKQACTEL